MSNRLAAADRSPLPSHLVPARRSSGLAHRLVLGFVILASDVVIVAAARGWPHVAGLAAFAIVVAAAADLAFVDRHP